MKKGGYTEKSALELQQEKYNTPVLEALRKLGVSG